MTIFIPEGPGSSGEGELAPFGPAGMRFPSGRPAASTAVAVLKGSVLVPLFDAEGMSITNPTHTDSAGNLYFWVEEGNYKLQINGLLVDISVLPLERYDDQEEYEELQEELTAHINSATPHPIYDDGPSFLVYYNNAKV